MICPQCNKDHSGSDEYCYKCLMIFAGMLESGRIQIMLMLAEWITSELTNRDHQPTGVDCPKCDNHFTI